MRRNCLLLLMFPVLLLPVIASAQSQPRVTLKAYTSVSPARDASGNVVSPASSSSSLATFTYNVTSTRDGNTYTGVMVGQDPFSSGFTPTNVTTPVIPLIIKTNSVATGVSAGGILTTTKGATTFNPTVADTACLSAPNDVPLTLFEQSPIFQPASFRFGHTLVGTTQYLDAFQRGNFWTFVAGTNYHTLVNPVVFQPVTPTLRRTKV